MPARPPGRFVFVSLLALAIVPAVAHATWPVDPNANLTVCGATGHQKNPVLAPDGQGGAFMVWWDARSDISDIYLQRVDQAGVPLWAANGIAVAAGPGAQWAQMVFADGTGGCIVAWADSSLGSSNSRQLVQRVDARGTVLWGAGGVRVCPMEYHQARKAVLADGAGGVFMVWGDQRSGGLDLYAQHLDASGAPLWDPNGVALCTAAGDQLLPTNVSNSIVPDGAGGFIVAWFDQRAGSGSDDIYARRVNSSGVPQWTPDGVALCTAVGAQDSPVICSNGLGGAIVAWVDLRTGVYQVYLQQVSAGGAPEWTPDGIEASAYPSAQTDPRLVSDGATGAILVWLDNRSTFDIYAQRLDNAGAPLWSSGDVALVTDPASQFGPEVVSDGAGGAVVSWRDERSGTNYEDAYAQHVDAAGTVLWGTDGAAISTAAGDILSVRLTSGSDGGAIIGWAEYRSGAFDIFAQRVTGDGTLGGREPRIALVEDVRPDQGGRVRVLWDRSDLDTGWPSGTVSDYTLWRRVITGAPGAPGASAARTPDDANEARTEGSRWRDAGDGAEATYWEYLVTVPAIGESGYGYTVATTSDSMAGLVPWNSFRVLAHTSTGRWYAAAVDSGYSTDDLAPPVPAPFTGAYAAGVTHLHWGASAAADVGHYALHRGASADFVPGGSNLVATPTDTSYADVGPAGAYYKLAAVDAHGNASAFALLTPAGTLDVPGASVAELALAPLVPSPAREATTLRFSLARAGRVTLAVFDVGGRRVRTLVDGRCAAGERAVPWDLRDGEGRAVRGGVYVVSLAAEGRALTRRVVVLR